MKLTSKTLFDFFCALPDYRNQEHAWKILHEIAEMLMCFVVAFLNGKSSGFQAWHWCLVHIDHLRSLGLTLENGLASYSTHMRMLQSLDSEAFMLEFIDWMNNIIVVYGVHLAIDGKGLRGGTEKNRGGKCPYVLNVVETEKGLTIASMPIDAKTNEIKAIPEILSLISVASNMITIDAIGTQIDIMNMIIEEEGSFLMLVKKNHPEAYSSLTGYFDTLRNRINEQAKDEKKKSDFSMPEDFDCTDWIFEKNHDRMEYRRAIVVHPNGNMDLISEILGAGSSMVKSGIGFQTIGMIETVRIPIEKDSDGNDITPSLAEFLVNGSRSCPKPKVGDSEDCDIQKVGTLSNRILSATEVLEIKRKHWSVEAIHHVLDVTFAEDYNPAKSSKYNCSLLRKIVLNIVTMAVINGDVKDSNSTPVEAIHLSGQDELLKKYLFGNPPVINIV